MFILRFSGRLLDVLINAIEPHDRHLLDKIAEGLRGTDRFKYTSLLFYAVRQKPAPMWLRKLPRHSVTKELLNTLSQNSDVTVLVSGILVLVVVLPILPYEMANHHLPAILDIFWNKIRWSPKHDHDAALKPYMQVAIYSLFHRLYALYPCTLLNYMRNLTVNQINKSCFLNTLRPMLEHVRLHPLLVSETKETETGRNRWVGMEHHQLLHECSKLCLDNLESTSEEISWSWLPNSNVENTLDQTIEPTSLILCQSENNFWSPGVIQSPATHTSSSIPHTPVYVLPTPSAHSLSRSSKATDSPPEAAIEATPESTPFTSPIKRDDSERPTHDIDALSGMSSIENTASPMSPTKKEISFDFPETSKRNIFSKIEKSQFLHSRLQQIHRDKQLLQETSNVLKNLESNENEVKASSDKEESDDFTLINNKTDSEIKENDSNERSKPRVDRVRKRKISVYSNENLKVIEQQQQQQQQQQLQQQLQKETDLSFAESPEDKKLDFQEEKKFDRQLMIEGRISEEKETSSENSRKESEVSSDGGIGVPTVKSMQDFLKNMRTNRLRFFSQCAAPPDLSFLTNNSVTPGPLSPCKSEGSDSKPIKRSLSCPNLDDEESFNPIASVRCKKLSSTVSSFTLSPTRPIGPLIEKCDSYTQTEENTVINPYEQLLEALLPQVKSKSNETDCPIETSSDYLSPHQMLSHYIKQIVNPIHEVNLSTNDISKEVLKNHLDAIHMLLLLERHKREMHAERNRRLLSKAKSIYVLQEKENFYKKEIESLLEEINSLKKDLLTMQGKSENQNISLQKAKKEHDSFKSNFKDDQIKVKQQEQVLQDKCSMILKENIELKKKLQLMQSLCLESNRKLTVQTKLTEENSMLKKQIETLQKQCILMGELQEQSLHQLWQLQMSETSLNESSLEMERSASLREIQMLKEEGRTANSSVRALMFRVKQLEKEIVEKNKLLSEKQNAVQSATEIGAEKCRAVERRCQALSLTNISLEKQVMDLHHKLDAASRQVRRSQRLRSGFGDSSHDIEFDLSHSPSSPSNQDGTDALTRHQRGNRVEDGNFAEADFSFININQAKNMTTIKDVWDSSDPKIRKNT